jgi:serine phosphatase RsbU (regulator of sigma subunit)
MLVSYTDGVTDAIGEHGERYGLSRLSRTLEHGRERSARSIIDTLASALEQFQSGAHADDTAALALRRLPVEPSHAEPSQARASRLAAITIPA